MKTNRKIAIILAIAFLLVLLPTLNVQAAYQSIGTGTALTQDFNTWMPGIRQMEGSGQGLGLSEEINTSTLLPKGASNNIDVHLQKNTEYGAVLLLGASDYGKQGATKEARYMDAGATTGNGVQASTTGNKYGVYEMGYYDMKVDNKMYEWTAGGASDFYNKTVASRYMNRYTTDPSSALAGDATTETRNWHGSRYANWLSAASYGFRRGNGGAFSYGSYDVGGTDYGRAAVVVGVGL